jgi:hypothetical protein
MGAPPGTLDDQCAEAPASGEAADLDQNLVEQDSEHQRAFVIVEVGDARRRAP